MKKRLIAFIVLLLCSKVVLADSRKLDLILDASYPPRDSLWDIAEVRIWIPAEVQKIRGILLNFHGYSGDSRPITSNETWKRFARKHHFALMGTHFYDGTLVEFKRAGTGSGDLLLKALTEFGQKSNHPELSQLPFCVWGMSLGGASSCFFADWIPERVIAFAAVNGNGRIYKEETRQAPALIFMSNTDNIVLPEGVLKFYMEHRAKGALWTLLMNWDVGHNDKGTDKIILPFFDSMIKTRLSKKQSTKLTSLSEENGWYGDISTWNQTAQIFPCKGEIQKDSTVWIPNKNLAIHWKNFVSKVK